MWIKKLKRKADRHNYKTAEKEHRAKFYASTQWKKLRDGYYMQHPLCEICEEKGLVVPAEDIHHIISPFKEKDVMYYFFNPNNLISTCKKCHGEIHGMKKESTLHNLFYQREFFGGKITDINNLIENENV